MSVEGNWNLKMTTPMGEQTPVLTLSVDGDNLSGCWEGQRGKTEFSDGTVDGNNLSWTVKMQAMGMEISMECTASVDGDQITGEVKTPRGVFNFSGQKA